MTETLSNHPNVELRREEVAAIHTDRPDEVTVIAAGPLASPALIEAIGRLTGERDLYFFDAISPIVDSETINYDVVFRAARYGKGGDDYVNCPMSKSTTGFMTLWCRRRKSSRMGAWTAGRSSSRAVCR